MNSQRTRSRAAWFSCRVLLIGASATFSALSFAGADSAGERDIEALVFNCYTCHGTDGVSPGSMHSLQGKDSDYIYRRLTQYREDKRHPTIMNRIAKGYTLDELARISDYLGGDDG